jgi:hypothetical protein
MRRCVKTGDYSRLPNLIEEAQGYVDDMENGLWNGQTAAEDCLNCLSGGKTKKAFKAIEKRWPRLKRYRKQWEKADYSTT